MRQMYDKVLSCFLQVVNFLGVSASEKEEEESEVDESGKMCFTLMTKKGNKVQVKHVWEWQSVCPVFTSKLASI